MILIWTKLSTTLAVSSLPTLIDVMPRINLKIINNSYEYSDSVFNFQEKYVDADVAECKFVIDLLLTGAYVWVEDGENIWQSSIPDQFIPI